MNKKNLLLVLFAACLCIATSFATVFIYSRLNNNQSISASHNNVPVKFAAMTNTQVGDTDFTKVAESTIHSVVHVKTKFKVRQENNYSGFDDPFFDFFFGPQQGRRGQPQEFEQQGAGSGVIISSDGYIVTNNHVVGDASTIQVTLNDKRTFDAKIVGSDPSTDIALIKIEAEELYPMPIGNSENLKVGEWVLAIGNPFNLTSTVTAGIVSAKARGINILNDEMRIESFIQTDAAINPGNSGGALVNIAGELVGINTAIASKTGSYSGYGFAVPTTIVSKIVADLKEYGTVQRAVLGVQIMEIDDKLAKDKNIKKMNGVYVAGVVDNSSAKDAGVKEGDIIYEIDGNAVNSVAELQERVASFRPGNTIKLTIERNGKKILLETKLKNHSGNTDIVKKTDIAALGAELEAVDKAIIEKFKIEGGVKVVKVNRNGLFSRSGIEKGFVILKIDRQSVYSPQDINNIYKNAVNSNQNDYKVMFVSGFYPPNKKIVHYVVNLT